VSHRVPITLAKIAGGAPVLWRILSENTLENDLTVTRIEFELDPQGSLSNVEKACTIRILKEGSGVELGVVKVLTPSVK
jgi:hypothetical protein